MQPEFSRFLDLSSVLEEAPYAFEATPEECQALSRRFQINLLSLKTLFSVTKHTDGVSHFLKGQVFLQLDEKRDISGELSLYFSPEGNSFAQEFFDEDQEWYTTPEIDVGEIVSQYTYFFILDTLEPQPPKEDETLGFLNTEERKKNPFEKLEVLLTKKIQNKPSIDF